MAAATMLRVLFAGLLTFLPAWLSCSQAIAQPWPALKDEHLAPVIEGSALDFSPLFEQAPAGAQGWALVLPDGSIGFSELRRPQRFLAASFAVSSGYGGMPSHADSDAIALELRRTGYNLARLHFVDSQLMHGRAHDLDFNPEQLDRLHYLLAALKRQGVYWLVDGLTSNNAAYGAVYPNRFVRRHRAKLDVLLGGAGLAHWRALVDALWGRTNPYTGQSTLKDPALLGVILVNEGGLGFLASTEGGHYPAMLQPLFTQWLASRYGDDSKLRAAWGGELASGESVAGQVDMPSTVRAKGRRASDFARFVVDLETQAYQRMEQHVRSRGFGGLTTSYNNWGFLGADITRSRLPWVDMHSYHVLPSAHGQVGSRIGQGSVHDNALRYVRELTNARQWGRPFSVTEYGQPFWNQWRHESAALLPAVAAHQGWDILCQFAEWPVALRYGASAHRREQAMYPYGVGLDPIARAGERLAALLYRRGDVQASPARLRLHVSEQEILQRSAGWEQIPEGVSRLGLTVPTGLEFGPAPASNAKGQLSLAIGAGTPQWVRQLEAAMLRAGLDSVAPGTSALHQAGLLPRHNRTRPSERLYETDTGQLLIDSRQRHLVVDTPQAAVAVLQSGSLAAGPLRVLASSGPALVAAAALDAGALPQSQRLLIWVLTDAVNTGMRFEDEARTTLRDLGQMPPRVRPVVLTLELDRSRKQHMQAWALSLRGERRQQLALEVQDKQISLRLDTHALQEGPSVFFELVVTAPDAIAAPTASRELGGGLGEGAASSSERRAP